MQFPFSPTWNLSSTKSTKLIESIGDWSLEQKVQYSWHFDNIGLWRNSFWVDDDTNMINVPMKQTLGAFKYGSESCCRLTYFKTIR